MRISKALAYSVFDSRGIPTIAVCLESENSYAIGMSPSGASTGSHEAFEMRDGEKAFGGKGVMKAITIFNSKVVPHLLAKEFNAQSEFDQALVGIDGTENFTGVGGNTAIAASIAFLKLSARLANKEPYEVLANEWGYGLNRNHCITPLVNVINGGKHASSGLAIQEFMIVPRCGHTTVEKISCAAEVFQALKSVLKAKGWSTLVGDEGGFAPPIERLEQAVELVKSACNAGGFVFGKDILLALDSAATEFYRDGQYHLEGRVFGVEELVDFYLKSAKDFSIVSIEDPFAEDDFVAWKMLAARVPSDLQIVGDDLTVTNVVRMKMVQDQKLVSSMIVKPNQIGTITQTMAAIQLAQKYGWKPILSHRSGETEDTIIADIAYAVSAPYIKTGSMSRSERLAKYNRLIGILGGC